jgi:hypothetical protein
MNEKVTPDKRQAAVCGLFCPSCKLFIATQEGIESLKVLAKQWQCSVESIECHGCRSDKRSDYCQRCTFVQCATEKGHNFCGECREYPCDGLKDFQSAKPHRLELWESLARINEVGYEKWLLEEMEHYACPECGTINSAYHLTCRKCGADPSSGYVKRHGEKIKEYMAKLR